MTNLGDLEVFVRVIAAGSMSTAGAGSRAVAGRHVEAHQAAGGPARHPAPAAHHAADLADRGRTGVSRAGAAVLARAGGGGSLCLGGARRRSAGTLKVSAPTSFGRLHIAPHLKPFMEAHPDLTIHLVLSDEFTDIVGDGFDLAIRIAELKDSSLVARRLAPMRRVLCASPDYLAAHGEPETLEDLTRHRLPAGAQSRRLAARGAAGRAQPPARRPADHQFERGDPRGGDRRARHRAALDLGHRRRN